MLVTAIRAVIYVVCSLAVFLINRAKLPLDLSMLEQLITELIMELMAWLVCSRGHLRDYCDYVYDGSKKLWNKWITFTGQPDVRKFNTMQKWQIGDRITTVRSGFPVITGRRTIWVDASDSHNLLLGSTRSGKTWSNIHEQIETTRMAGESMFVNDLKGELLRAHRHKLIESGYQVISINFIKPAQGDQWNPFGLTIKAYRAAQAAAYAQMDEEFRTGYLSLKKEYLLVNGEIQALIHKAEKAKNNYEQSKITQEIHELMETQSVLKDSLFTMESTKPEVNLSETSVYLEDVAKAIFPNGDLTMSKADSSTFWNLNGMRMLEGIVWFLLEYEYIDDDGNIAHLDDDQINFKNFQLTVINGFKKIRTDINSDPDLLLRFYVTEMRQESDNSARLLLPILNTPEETRGSIEGVFATYTDLGITNDDVSKMLSRSSFDFDEMFEKKIAVFMISHDEKPNYYPLVVLFLNQMLEEVATKARNEDTLRLKYPLNVIFDEFGIAPPIRNLNNILSAARSKGVRFTMVIQDFSQLSIQYSRDFSEMIKSNTMNMAYLLSGSQETRKEMSDLIGEKLQWNKEKGNYEAVPIVTKDRLARFSVGEAVIVSQRKNPYITRYTPFDKYIFYKSLGKPEDPPVQVLVKQHLFSLVRDYYKLCKQAENAFEPVEDNEKNIEQSSRQNEKKTTKAKKKSGQGTEQQTLKEPLKQDADEKIDLNIKDLSQMDE